MEKYPDWAPASVIDSYVDLAKNDRSPPFYFAYDENINIRKEITYAFLTDQRAKEVWRVISKQEYIRPPLPLSSTKEVDYLHMCAIFIQSMRHDPFHTPAEKRKHLKEIAAKAKELRNLIVKSPYIDNRFLIAEIATKESYLYSSQHRTFSVISAAEEIRRDQVRRAINNHAEACEEWRKSKGLPETWDDNFEAKIDYSDFPNEEDYWEDRYDMPWLIGCYSKLTLPIILRRLEAYMRFHATHQPLVSRPGGTSAKITYFSRELYMHHMRWFGTPLWDTLALATSIALKTEETLSADDVRPSIPRAWRLIPKKR